MIIISQNKQNYLKTSKRLNKIKTMKEKLGQEPAFPVSDNDYGNIGIHGIGISKRFYAACSFMQGMLASRMWMDLAKEKMDAKEIMTNMAKASYEFADELLKQENE